MIHVRYIVRSLHSPCPSRHRCATQNHARTRVDRTMGRSQKGTAIDLHGSDAPRRWHKRPLRSAQSQARSKRQPAMVAGRMWRPHHIIRDKRQPLQQPTGDAPCSTAALTPPTSRPLTNAMERTLPQRAAMMLSDQLCPGPLSTLDALAPCPRRETVLREHWWPRRQGTHAADPLPRDCAASAARAAQSGARAPSSPARSR